ncbi:hypothetical protein Vadar_007222 [Vaccinium darrowii]|uniref:Uncharacterized protein n=1 Tax=Vaccinium darrowii TaxID=229202 RepID=A0ACB7ZAI2_9ERIC|nr:hypothetical protein Vadar_007222 [Vaccinium darrowii]
MKKDIRKQQLYAMAPVLMRLGILGLSGALFGGNLRLNILMSMLIQCLLVFFASERKRRSKGCLLMLISTVHSLKDWLAAYTIGLISANQGSSAHCATPAVGHLLAFWAPFVLLHLGGPDDSTSLSTRTDDRWLEKVIRLGSNVMLISLICIRALPNNPLYLATLAVFVAGTLKYAERVGSLYLASSESWKGSVAIRLTPDVGPDYEKLSMAQLAIREANLPIEVKSEQLPTKKFKPYFPMPRDMELDFDTDNSELDGRSLLLFANLFYINFRGFFIDGLTYSHEQRLFTRNFFLKRSSRDAFKLAEIELSFLYDDLHTKTTIIRIPALRFVTTTLVAAASYVFYLYDKRGLWKIDIGISYALLFGALGVEIVSLLMLLFSGRNVIALKYYSFIMKPFAIVARRKWSESFNKCNLICYCLFCRTPSIKILRETILHTGIVRIAFTSATVSKSLKDKIFTELCKRSELALDIETATKICSQRGDWVLIQRSCYPLLKWSLGEIEYGHSLLLWHIATDLLYSNCAHCRSNASCSDHCHSNASCSDHCHSNPSCSDRQFSKEISEYLLYLLLAKPKLIAPVAGHKWVKTFWDTSLEAKKLCNKSSIKKHEQACQVILSMESNITPVLLEGEASASVLFDASILAKQLLEFKEDKRWSLMSEVWMELLTYAAIHCKGIVHAKQPSQGGELLTFVWLLMNHLGLGKQFRKERARTGYRVVVRK